MPPKKKVLAVVKIQLEAGSATPAPPVGTALGPHGVQTMEFCKQYNQQTESMRGQGVILLDGGVRRGADVLKALARGANAVLIGRSYLYGLAVRGAEGVKEVVDTLRLELEIAMALAGCASLSDIDSSLLRIPKQS